MADLAATVRSSRVEQCSEQSERNDENGNADNWQVIQRQMQLNPVHVASVPGIRRYAEAICSSSHFELRSLN